MRVRVEARVLPVVTEGRGVPFSPRTTYRVEERTVVLTDDLESVPFRMYPEPFRVYGEYWSRVVANRIVQERVQILRAYAESAVDTLRSSPLPALPPQGSLFQR